MSSGNGSSANGARVRASAARVLAGVLAGKSMDVMLGAEEDGWADTQDRTLMRAICYGTVREHRLLACLRDRLLDHPLKAGKGRLGALLEVGLHQLRSMHVPDHAAVAETVSAAALLREERARGLVNAVLRRYQREADKLEPWLQSDPALRHSCPQWLADTLRKEYPENWERLLEAGNEHPPMVLRVNLRRLSRAEYLNTLAEAGIPAAPTRCADSAVVLEKPVSVRKLPGFDRGRVSVQDGAAQLAAPLLAPAAGERVLDACAAPGGKTAHLLESCPEARILALDRDAQRLERVRENIGRTGGEAEVICADAADTAAWWGGEPFNRILLDAPCSGTGVIRRHPDIKWLRRREDIPRMAQRQRGLLEALWECLAPGGVLLYATCSILPDENEQVVGNFVRAREDARVIPIAAEWGCETAHGRRIPTGEGGMDGFYFARLAKSTLAGL